MKTSGVIRLYCLLALCSLALFGGCESADERQSFDQLKADPDRAMAMKYKNILEAKNARINEILLKLDIPKDAPFNPATARKTAAYMTTAEGEELKSYFEDFYSYLLYYTNVKEKGGDVSGLEIDTEKEELKDMIMPPIRKEELPPDLMTI